MFGNVSILSTPTKVAKEMAQSGLRLPQAAIYNEPCLDEWLSYIPKKERFWWKSWELN